MLSEHLVSKVRSTLNFSVTLRHSMNVVSNQKNPNRVSPMQSSQQSHEVDLLTLFYIRKPKPGVRSDRHNPRGWQWAGARYKARLVLAPGSASRTLQALDEFHAPSQLPGSIAMLTASEVDRCQVGGSR